MKKRSILVLLFVLCTAVFMLLANPLTTHAAPGDHWARWVIQMAFDDDKIDAQMIIEVGRETPWGTQVIEIQKSYPLSCQEIGSLIIANSTASFDGSSYLHCEMPDFQQQVKELTEGKLEIEDSCSCKQAYGQADFTFYNPTGNALFYRPDMALSAPLLAGSSQAQYQLVVNGTAAISEPFLANGLMQRGRAQFSQINSGYAPSFVVDGFALGSTPAFLPGKLEISTTQTEFFVGFNPETGEFLSGKLGGLEVDPGCVGHGGL